MTGKALAITAAGALTVAVVAVAVRPLLSTTHHHAAAAPAAVESGPAAVDTIAVEVARADLRCAPGPSGRLTPRACGSLRVTRRQTRCMTSSRCSVDLIGAVATKDFDVPVALTVTVTRVGSAWNVVEVAS
jgi:hypothetical protein